MVFQWSTDSVPPAERFAHWREACCQHVYALTPERSERGPFRGHIARRHLGALDVADIRCDGHLVQRRPQDIDERPSDTFYLYVQREGRAWFEQGNRRQVAERGDIVIADPDVPFTTGTDGAFDFRLWRIDRARLQPMLAPRAGGLPMIKVARGGERDLIAGWLDSLLRSQADLPSASLAIATGTLCALVANAAGAAPEMREHGRLARRRALLQRVMREVEARASDIDLGTTAIAAEFGISLRTLHQLFELSDTTFNAFLTHARLARAHALLLDPAARHLSTMEVGFAAGFREVSTFYRRFGQRYGLTPGELRATAMAAL